MLTYQAGSESAVNDHLLPIVSSELHHFNRDYEESGKKMENIKVVSRICNQRS